MKVKELDLYLLVIIDFINVIVSKKVVFIKVCIE